MLAALPAKETCAKDRTAAVLRPAKKNLPRKTRAAAMAAVPLRLPKMAGKLAKRGPKSLSPEMET
mgnify:CR=1 FL=1